MERKCEHEWGEPSPVFRLRACRLCGDVEPVEMTGGELVAEHRGDPWWDKPGPWIGPEPGAVRAEGGLS